MRRLTAAARTAAPLAALALLADPVLPCSAFLIAEGGRVLFGNNEDYWDPETRVWFVPATEGRRGVMYLGFANGFPQGGMNDAGLAFDGFATAEHPLTAQDGKESFAGNPISEVMETCTTVAEAVAFLEGIDLAPLLTRAMLFFADATGDAVIVEGDEFLRKEGALQVVTNFYQSAQDDDLAQCPRYAAAVRTLEARDGVSTALCERALSAAAQRGSRVATVYSNIFDLRARTARLYLFHDYEHAVELDLAEELAKGARTLRLPDLFPANPAFEAFVAAQRLSVDERIAKRRGPPPPEERLAACAGSFDLDVLGEAHRVLLSVGDGTLVAESEALRTADGALVLYPETATTFFAVTSSGELTLRLELDGDGTVTGFTLAADGAEYRATRVE